MHTVHIHTCMRTHAHTVLDKQIMCIIFSVKFYLVYFYTISFIHEYPDIFISGKYTCKDKSCVCPDMSEIWFVVVCLRACACMPHIWCMYVCIHIILLCANIKNRFLSGWG